MGLYKTKYDIVLGAILMGITGVLIGFVIESYVTMVLAGLLGCVIGGFVGWLGGRRFMVIICLGALAGGVVGYRSGDRDILIVAAGSGAAIAGFVAAQLELFIGKK